MDELVGILLFAFFAVVFAFRCAAVDALAVFPGVLHLLVIDIAFRVVKTHNGILALRILAAVDASP